MILVPYNGAITTKAPTNPQRLIPQRFGGIVMSRLTGQEENTPKRTSPESFFTQFYRRHLMRITTTIGNTGQQWLQKIGLLQAEKAPQESMLLAFSASGRALMEDIELPPVKSFHTEPTEPVAKSTSHDFNPETPIDVSDKAPSKSPFKAAYLPENLQSPTMNAADRLEDLSASTTSNASSIEMIDHPPHLSKIDPDDLEAGWSLVEEARNETADQQFRKPSRLSGLHKRFALNR